MQGGDKEIKQIESHLKMSGYEDKEQFKIKDINSYPNRLICYIKLKILSQNRTSVFGTGCLIDEKYLITSAHTIQGFKQAIKPGDKIQGYVKQALHQGKMLNQYQIKLETIRMSQHYKTNKKLDYALLEIEPYEKDESINKEDKYIPMIALKEGEASKIKEISLYGYPWAVNKKQSKDQAPSSMFMANAYGSEGKPISFSPKQLTYPNPTDKGVSGGPISSFDVELNQQILIGIHKGGTQAIGYNFGVTSYEMLEEVNEWGFQLREQPFVFTKETFFMRNNPNIQKLDVFNLMDRNFDSIDMNVLSNFNLSHLKKLILSGNRLQEKGVKNLLKRPLPSLVFLFLSHNQIRSLDSIQDGEWKHLLHLQTLSLSLNFLTTLPENMKCLTSVKKFWICYNNLKQIPKVISQFNSEGKQIQKTVFIYQNHFKHEDPLVRAIKDDLEKRNVLLEVIKK